MNKRLRPKVSAVEFCRDEILTNEQPIRLKILVVEFYRNDVRRKTVIIEFRRSVSLNTQPILLLNSD